jgi:hypothetical protein
MQDRSSTPVDDPSVLNSSRRRVLQGLCASSVAAMIQSSGWAKPGRPKPVFCCSAENDFFRAVRQAGIDAGRFDKREDAFAHAQNGSGVLWLAETYPAQPLLFTHADLQVIREKHLRVFAEYSSGPFTSEGPKPALLKRAVVTSTRFGASLPPFSLLSAHDCQFLEVAAPASEIESHLVLAEVAGFDRAPFGLPEKTYPLLFEHKTERVLLAATKLSGFVTMRYGPSWAWVVVMNAILEWLSQPGASPKIKPQAAVAPSWSAKTILPEEAEAKAFLRGVSWYSDARFLIAPSWHEMLTDATKFRDNVTTGPGQHLPVGDGSLGVLEGHSSQILPDGSQPVRWWIRADCVAETAMVMALSHAMKHSTRDRSVAANLLQYLRESIMVNGVRVDPRSQSYGLLGWNTMPNYHNGENGYDVYYGDDNARSLLGVLTASTLLKSAGWQERMWMGILANFRLLGTNGQQLFRYDEAPLEKNGWRHYYEAPTVLYDMNYQAYPWALFLWAYSKTGYKPFLERTYTGIRQTMEAYPLNWKAADSITSSQARLLLPLAWLVRVSPSAETRSWLNRIGGDILSHQVACGAIEEWFQPRMEGVQGPPRSNAEYGTSEGPIIQNNGDPAADLLYTNNFAFIGLHEAYAATGDSHWKEAEDRLAAFLVRAQVQSSAHPELSGAWFRAFDFQAWDYWASNSDSGWGAWCTETGWSQSWIASTFGLRLLSRSLWDVVSAAPAYPGFPQLAKSMFPE